jgi:hypothetical protein
MRQPLLSDPFSPSYAEPIAIGIALVGIGAFIGAWVIGPALTHKTHGEPQAVYDRPLTYQQMIARPDPFPYRTATPEFDTSFKPQYAEMARDKARAELGEGRATRAAAARDAMDSFDAAPEFAPSAPAPTYRYRPFDRHRVY